MEVQHYSDNDNATSEWKNSSFEAVYFSYLVWIDRSLFISFSIKIKKCHSHITLGEKLPEKHFGLSTRSLMSHGKYSCCQFNLHLKMNDVLHDSMCKLLNVGAKQPVAKCENLIISKSV